jgi:hypothetical protein
MQVIENVYEEFVPPSVQTELEVVFRLIANNPVAFDTDEHRGETLRNVMKLCARQLPLEHMDRALAIVADKLDAHRRENKGYTPRSIFKSCIEIGMSYACAEIVLWRQIPSGERTGVYLKMREQTDQGWAGKKHIPGVSLLPFETIDQMFARLTKEVTDNHDWFGVSFFQVARRPLMRVNREDTDLSVEHRRVNCMTPVWEKVISTEDEKYLKPGFVYVPRSEFGDESIVDHHRDTLAMLY